MSDKPKPDDHQHCWHSTGTILAVYPPHYEEVCCWCGEKRAVGPYGHTDGEHGPHMPHNHILCGRGVIGL